MGTAFLRSFDKYTTFSFGGDKFAVKETITGALWKLL